MKQLFTAMCLPLLVIAVTLESSSCLAQYNGFSGVNMVGGVLINANGAIVDIRPQLRKELAGKRDQAVSKVPVPKYLGDGSQLRKISLRTLQDALVVAAGDRNWPLPPRNFDD